MISIIIRIFYIILAVLLTVAFVLCISLYKDILNLDAKLKQKDINHTKKEAYKEILKSLDDKLSDCDVMSDGEYYGYYCSDIRDILRELENEYEIYS